jgi:hypothetical protein
MNCSLVVNAFQCLDQITWGGVVEVAALGGGIALFVSMAAIFVKLL